jgi:hypothetical protein
LREELQIEGADQPKRTLFSALRKVNKRTTLRVVWTSGDRIERSFDYVLKKTITG